MHLFLAELAHQSFFPDRFAGGAEEVKNFFPFVGFVDEESSHLAYEFSHVWLVFEDYDVASVFCFVPTYGGLG